MRTLLVMLVLCCVGAQSADAQRRRVPTRDGFDWAPGPVQFGVRGGHSFDERVASAGAQLRLPLWSGPASDRVLECSSLLTVQASGEGTATWLFARVNYLDTRRPQSIVVRDSELEVIFGTPVVEAGSEHAGQIYGRGTDTFRVDFILTYETMLEEDPGPTREAAYSYTCRAP